LGIKEKFQEEKEEKSLYYGTEENERKEKINRLVVRNAIGGIFPKP